MKTNPRHLAIKILCQRHESGQPVDLIRERILRKTPPDNAKDTQLITALVYGVLRRQRYLDAILGMFSRHPLAKMKNLTLQGLRVGLFQLCFMDRIPPSAAVDETVNALKEARQPKWLTGFVNGMLRGIARQIDTLPDPSSPSLPPAVRLSHPDWLYQRWHERYGEEEATRICLANNRQPPLVLRVNTRFIGRESYLSQLRTAGLTPQPGLYCPDAIILSDFRGDIAGLPGYEEGLFMVQDEGAQLISLLLAPLGAEWRYLDACAGLGGKTTHLAQLLPAGGQVVAIEPNESRFRLLQENVKRLGQSGSVSVHQTTLAGFKPESGGPFQAILVDAPCSGLGVIRRQPDIRWNRHIEDLKRYQLEQLALLGEAAQLLAPRGVLVYATCSIEPEENEEVMAKFLGENPNFTVARPQALPIAARKFIHAKGFLWMLPDEGHDGFFAARLEKQ
ncbi:MAG: 16S rRNA (cytosine(967)-C(5))-methyltransferase RsmB [Deltaproteobacteria bacterium]|nr:16S rRNA (cytosine(967)-C(5))-methyltransferase RsmB [Deltaproteobacteria bacterium]